MSSCGLQPSQVEGSACEQSRMPLATQTNSFQSSSFQRQLRHKSTLISRIDSSEEPPSSHESIFEAEYCSNVNSEDSSNKNDAWHTLALDSVSGFFPIASSNENQEVILASPIGLTPILYGHGTPLTTIIEQKSSTTMHTIASTSSRTRSASDLAYLNSKCSYSLLGHPSFELSPNVTIRSPRHRKSFSANDLEPLKLSQPTENSSSLIASEGYEIYAQPRRPVIPPIPRSPTPPGMPSWTAGQNPCLHNATPQQGGWPIRVAVNRMRRFFRVPLSGAQFSSRIPLSAYANGPDLQLGQNTFQGSRGVPRFRPSVSGHGQPLNLHPFVRDSSAIVKGADLASPSRTIPQIQPQPSIQTLQASRRANRSQCKRKIWQKVRSTPRALDEDVPLGLSPTNRRPSATNAETGYAHHQNWCSSLLTPSSGLESYPSNPDYTVPSSAYQNPLEPAADMPFVTSPSSAATPRSIPLISTATSEERKICWKCRVERVIAIIDDLLAKSATWCFWMCCEVDQDYDGTSVVETSGSGSHRTARE